MSTVRPHPDETADDPFPPTFLSATMLQFPSLLGATFGPSPWHVITQQDIDDFAEVSGDHNPIHIDAAYAEASPYGGRIAHGLLTLSRMVPMLRQVFSISDATLRINYGLDRVRFPAAVRAGDRIRLRGEVKSIAEFPGGFQTVLSLAYELEDSVKPACVADWVARYYRATQDADAD
jgi:acyl dehydratase